MGFDLNALRQTVAQHGRVARVVIASVQGSSPREVGAAMLVWDGGQSGTIGGGALEYERALAALYTDGKRLTRHALGPELGQCCGGAVQVLTEIYHALNLPDPNVSTIARNVGDTHDMPLRVQKMLAQSRAKGLQLEPTLCDGWFIEPVQAPNRDLWIWGAGHVGRAFVDTFTPLPEFAITWIDTSADRFPDVVPNTVTKLPAEKPAALVPHAPSKAQHLIVTYSHALDLELCHQLLMHDFRFAGLIGSKSKWARFQSRLGKIGHSNAQIARITCPIGEPNLGKHPQAIAIGVASSLLVAAQTSSISQRSTA